MLVIVSRGFESFTEIHSEICTELFPETGTESRCDHLDYLNE